MRRGSDHSQTDFVLAFSKVKNILTFRRRQQKSAGSMEAAAEGDSAKWTQTYWGRKLMKSV